MQEAALGREHMKAGAHVQVLGDRLGRTKAAPLKRLKQPTALAAVLIGSFFALGLQPALASVPYSLGDVFAGVGNGKINHYGPTGTLKEVLDTTTGAANPPGNETGMCFDPTGK